MLPDGHLQREMRSIGNALLPANPQTFSALPNRDGDARDRSRIDYGQPMERDIRSLSEAIEHNLK